MARAMPESWHRPERIAARMVGASSLWNALLHAADIQRDNRDAIEACRKSATMSRQPVRCTERIRAENKAER